MTELPPRSSFDENWPVSGDAANMVSLFRPALIETEGFRSFGLARNISPWGLIATVHGLVLEGQPISVRFNEALKIEGELIWTEADSIGIAFTTKIDIPSFLDELSSKHSGGKDYRRPTLAVDLQGQFLVHSKPYPIILQKISQRGIKASVDSVSVGEKGTLTFPGMQPKWAVVRWVRQATASFDFAKPLSFAEFGKWVLDLGTRRRRGKGS